MCACNFIFAENFPVEPNFPSGIPTYFCFVRHIIEAFSIFIFQMAFKDCCKNYQDFLLIHLSLAMTREVVPEEDTDTDQEEQDIEQAVSDCDCETIAHSTVDRERLQTRSPVLETVEEEETDQEDEGEREEGYCEEFEETPQKGLSRRANIVIWLAVALVVVN